MLLQISYYKMKTSFRDLFLVVGVLEECIMLLFYIQFSVAYFQKYKSADREALDIQKITFL